jgi:septal ring factor EnvC (AmiA/AmiB activator)
MFNNFTLIDINMVFTLSIVELFFVAFFPFVVSLFFRQYTINKLRKNVKEMGNELQMCNEHLLSAQQENGELRRKIDQLEDERKRVEMLREEAKKKNSAA